MMRRPEWRRDHAGFSGGWWPADIERPRQLTALGIYGYGYFVDVCAPVIGDLRVGWTTSEGLRNPYRRRMRKPNRHLTFERRPWLGSE